jgi:hypothetical protein
MYSFKLIAFSIILLLLNMNINTKQETNIVRIIKIKTPIKELILLYLLYDKKKFVNH